MRVASTSRNTANTRFRVGTGSGLGIPEVGLTVARDLSEHFRSFFALRRAGPEELKQVRGVGPKMAAQIHAFFEDSRNQKILDDLLSDKVELVEPCLGGGWPLEGLKFVFTAAAPLPANISEFFAAKRIPVVEGWGLTETSPCCTLTDMSERREVPGVVGYPIPGVELRLAADGEILVPGPNVMRGYHGNPEATARALPGDGWFRTGDLGEIAGSALKLLTRKDRTRRSLRGA